MTQTQVNKALVELRFSITKPGTMKTVASVGNRDYFLTQAQVLIQEAKTEKDTLKLQKAAQLLVLAMVCDGA